MAFPDDYTAWGGTAADFTTSRYDLKDGITLIRSRANPVTIWDGPGEDANRVMDLYDHTNAPVHELLSAASGLLRRFWAPSSYTELWASVQDGEAVQLVPHAGSGPGATDETVAPLLRTGLLTQVALGDEAAESGSPLRASIDARVAAAVTTTPLELLWDGTGSSPPRPATTRPVHFRGPTAPSGAGTTAGGGWAMVPTLDSYFWDDFS